MKEHGSWGVAHTTVPTESRPGHVALLAGIYEDPSAIAKGWKENPVDFDSVINQSRNAYGWGSPDIMKIFNKGDEMIYCLCVIFIPFVGGQPHVHLKSYTSQMEDFAKRSIDLDEWVLKEVVNKLREERDNSQCNEFCLDGNLYFLHLLGMDSVGHASKPNSLSVFFS